MPHVDRHSPGRVSGGRAHVVEAGQERQRSGVIDVGEVEVDNAIRRRCLAEEHGVQIGYDAAPDGKWFLVNSPPAGSPPPLTLITHWAEALEQLPR